VAAQGVAQSEAEAAEQHKAEKERQQLERAKRQLGVALAAQRLKVLLVKNSVHGAPSGGFGTG
jgi:hypothetical protein